MADSDRPKFGTPAWNKALEAVRAVEARARGLHGDAAEEAWGEAHALRARFGIVEGIGPLDDDGP